MVSLLFKTLSRFDIVILQKSSHLLISWLLSPSKLILEPKKMKSDTVSTFSPSICHEVIGPDAMILVFECWVLSQLFHSPLSPSSRGSLSASSLSAIKVVSSAYLRLLIFLLAILIPDCDSSSLAFHLMYSAYKLNKQGDNIQPWRTPFLICNQSVVPCLVWTVVSCPTYRFLRRQVKWSGIPPTFRIFQFVVIHKVKGFSIVNEAEVGVFLKFPYFFYDPAYAGNLISGSSAFSKSSFYIWKFLVHILLKSSLKDFEQNLAGMWNECSCTVIWTFWGIAFLWDWNKNRPFSVLWPLMSFPYLLV